MVSSKRVAYLDTAKGVGILLVLFGHLFTYGQPVSNFIFSFHMPLFFFISGACFCPSEPSNAKFKTFALKRVRSLLVPYVVYCLTGLALTLLIPGWGEGFSLRGALFEACYLAAPNMLHVGQIWFLVCLFFVEMIGFAAYRFVFIKKRTAGDIAAIALFVCLGALAPVLVRFIPFGRYPLMLDTACTAFVFYALGFLMRENRILELMTRVGTRMLLMGSLAIFGFLAYATTYLGWVNIAALIFNNLFLYYVCAIAGCLATIMLAAGIARRKKAEGGGIFQTMGRNSLMLFSIHSCFLYALSDIATKAYGYPIVFGVNMPIEVILVGGFTISVILLLLAWGANALRGSTAAKKIAVLRWAKIV